MGYRDWARRAADTVSEVLTADTVHWHEQWDARCPAADLTYLLGWSDIIPPDDIAGRTVLVLHPSKLPAYRGGSPIQHQIMDGLQDGGVAIFKIDDAYPGVDTGPIAWTCGLDLRGSIDGILLELSDAAISGVLDTVYRFRSGAMTYEPQDEGGFTLRRRKPEQSEITVDEIMRSPARALADKIRALQPPYPTAFIRGADGQPVYLRVATLHDGNGVGR